MPAILGRSREQRDSASGERRAQRLSQPCAPRVPTGVIGSRALEVLDVDTAHHEPAYVSLQPPRPQRLPPKPLPLPPIFSMEVVPEMRNFSVPWPHALPRTSAHSPSMLLPFRMPLKTFVQERPLSLLMPTHQMVLSMT